MTELWQHSKWLLTLPAVFILWALACANEVTPTPIIVPATATNTPPAVVSAPTLTPLPTITPEQAHPRAETIDAFLTAIAAANQFMGTVLVARGDEVLFVKGYGFANLEFAAMNSRSTRFRLGPVSRSYTAAGILLLQQEGLLNVADPVRLYIESVPSETLTIEHLLTHSSGLADFTANADILEYAGGELPPDELLSGLLNDGLLFEPGTRFSYSHTDYFLLAYLIELISGQSF